MRILIATIAAVVLSVLIIASCTKDKVEIVTTPVNTNCPDTILYSTQIQPILNQSCATSGCHPGGASSNGYDLTNHSSVSANATIILNVIRHDNSVISMPLGATKLPDSVAQHIECWISQGKLNN
ncbi:MAG: hypothetical protein MK105_01190 [Crocinitomicaceae bacterium]|nr:hypothetical protein [Crocinitomicaceae bacterium]